VATRAPDAYLGVDLGAVTRDEAWAALGAGWGWSGDTTRASIDPDCTLAGVHRALGRLRSVGARGGRVAVATGRPASLLPLAATFATAAVAAGAELLSCDQFGPIGSGRRMLWWHDEVAVVTDGDALLADDGSSPGRSGCSRPAAPDLVVADRGFAGAALAARHEVVAIADLDAVALGLAAARGSAVTLVPLDERCPPAAYAPLEELLTAEPEVGPAESGREGTQRLDAVVADDRPDGVDPAQGTQAPHSTTLAPGAYAAPESGGEG
jgi:hypothetical protein